MYIWISVYEYSISCTHSCPWWQSCIVCTCFSPSLLLFSSLSYTSLALPFSNLSRLLSISSLSLSSWGEDLWGVVSLNYKWTLRSPVADKAILFSLCNIKSSQERKICRANYKLIVGKEDISLTICTLIAPCIILSVDTNCS